MNYMDKEVECKRGFNAGYGDYPNDAVYNDITPNVHVQRPSAVNLI